MASRWWPRSSTPFNIAFGGLNCANIGCLQAQLLMRLASSIAAGIEVFRGAAERHLAQCGSRSLIRG
jgi:hypothetical protein